MAQMNFNANEHQPAVEMGALPAGEYPSIIIDTDVGPKNNGIQLKVVGKILSGPCAGRQWVLYHWNQHTNADCQRIGQAEISSLCHAVNVLNMVDTQQLHNKKLIAKLKHVPATGTYKEKNEFGMYKALTETVNEAPQAPQSTPAQSEEAPGWAQ